MSNNQPERELGSIPKSQQALTCTGRSTSSDPRRAWYSRRDRAGMLDGAL